MTIQKKNRIRLPQPGKEYDDTYCVFTVYQIYSLMVLILILIFDQIYLLVMILMGDDLMVQNENCQMSQLLVYWSFIKDFETVILFNIIMIIQVYEWIFIYYLIKT
jgi:hypothetical protein